MKTGFAAIIADALALWRSERDLLAAISGVFFVIPLLGLVLLLTGSDLGKEQTPEQFRDALVAFQSANLLPILFGGLMLDFGSFAAMNLFLQGGGRTLGQVLLLTAQRFLPFVLISMIASSATSIGLSLFLLPGLFIFARSWLAGAAYAAQPGRGMIWALREGWRLSGGMVWPMILLAALLAAVPVLFVGVFVATMATALAMALGAGEAGALAGNLVIAAAGAALWSWLAVLRVAFYRATGDSKGT